jgi:hypothetical protein
VDYHESITVVIYRVDQCTQSTLASHEPLPLAQSIHPVSCLHKCLQRQPCQPDWMCKVDIKGTVTWRKLAFRVSLVEWWPGRFIHASTWNNKKTIRHPSLWRPWAWKRTGRRLDGSLWEALQLRVLEQDPQLLHCKTSRAAVEQTPSLYRNQHQLSLEHH